MKEKSFKNLKNKIGLKNFLVSKNEPNFRPKNINIKTINIKKNFSHFNEDKNFFSEKYLNKIIYYDSKQNYNIVTKNDYFQKKNKRNHILNSSDSESIPSPISLMNSSPYIPSGKKKYKRRRIHKKNIRNKRSIKYNNASNSSIQNLSFNTNSNSYNKKNISYIYSNSSSSEKEEYDYSDSSDTSYKSRENKRKKYLDKMLVEENELDYLKKSEVGLNSTEEEDNNSVDNNNSIEENFNNEIERILIEIYNKNISLISSGNVYEINKSFGEVQDIERQIKKYLKRENLKTNLLVLKSLSNKIKELIGKYKEKVFEIEEIKSIKFSLQRQILNEQIFRCNNSLESNVATNYNSNESYNSYIDEDNFIKNNLVLKPEDEINKKGVTHILLRELINIKRTLKVSSKEIEGIFKYPLNILKNDEGKKIKFSIELMQREEFCKTLLEDDLISNILIQIKEIFFKEKNQKVTKWLFELDESYQHKNEMTKFVKYINDKLPIKTQNYNKTNESNYLEELKSDEEKDVDNNNNININDTPVDDMNKKIKKRRNKRSEEEKIMNKEEDKDKEEMQFKDIDEILNYINDDTDSKKGKKKCKKGKKNKNKNSNKEEKENQLNKNNNGNDNEEVRNLLNDFDKEFEDFKNDIAKDTIFIYEINSKIKPCLSDNFLNSISII